VFIVSAALYVVSLIIILYTFVTSAQQKLHLTLGGLRSQADRLYRPRRQANRWAALAQRERRSIVAQKEITVIVKLDFSELENLFDEYVSEKPDDDGTEVYGSYRSQARDQVNDFLAWLKRRPTPRALDDGQAAAQNGQDTLPVTSNA